MTKTKKEGWINICKDKEGKYQLGLVLHPTKIQAIRGSRVYGHRYIASAKVEWEEEV